MNKRPLSVIIIACLFIATGVFALASDLMALKPHQPVPHDTVWAALVHFLAIVCGVYLLRGSNWARWLAIAWMAFHVVLSIFESWFGVALHSLLCALLAYFLFRAQANRYFRVTRTPVA